MSIVVQKDFLFLDFGLPVADARLRFEQARRGITYVITGSSGRFYRYPIDAFLLAFKWYDDFAAGQEKTIGSYAVFQREEFLVKQTIALTDVKALKSGNGNFLVFDGLEVAGYIINAGKSAGPVISKAKPKPPVSADIFNDRDLESYTPPPPPCPPPQASPPAAPPQASPPAAEPLPEAFEAFPTISDPGNIKPGARFSVDIGFSKDLDQTLQAVHQIHIDHPSPTDFIEVSLMANGAEIENNRLKMLPLDLDAKVKFDCVALDQATEISLMAVFLYKRQPVGTAVRVINGGVSAPGFNFKLPAPTTEDSVDITAIIRWDRQSGQLSWNMVGPNVDATATKLVNDTQEFAASISNQLDPNVNDIGPAFNILATLGQNIAALVPEAFFKALNDVYVQFSRPPRVLILTDEPYIPWELAYHQDLALEKSVEPFLHLQTLIGRWWLSDQVLMPPPTGLSIKRLSVVATDYSNNPGVTELLEASNEKNFLIKQFNAQDVKAEQKSLLALTGAKPHADGQMLHMALHGLSKADLNEQEIIMEDGKSLSANALIGPYFQGQVPAISFMFLNACQVGTAGRTLGQASGFPGIMLKKGMFGFIAPLWSVDDVPARTFCEKFYQNALAEGRPIGEVLLELRRSVNFADSLTELAYIYYGHPALTLQKSY